MFNNSFNRNNERTATCTYVVVATIPKNVIATVLYWDNAEPYHYMRYQIIGGNSNGLTHGTVANIIVANDVSRVVTQQSIALPTRLL